MILEELNKLGKPELAEALHQCCGSTRWVSQLSQYHPFRDRISLFALAREIWFERCRREDWLEAFSHHPRIGDLDGLAKKFVDTREWSENEQAGVGEASRETLEALASGNRVYEEKFGYIFIVCATGKHAAEMLEILTERLRNDPEQEIETAMREQYKITELRLEKLLE